MDIRDVVARRVDLSTFLVHLARDTALGTARDALHAILTDWRIEARSAFGPAVSRLANFGLPDTSQRCVCFTETPLEHTYWLLQEIAGRAIRLQPYGVAVPKKVGRKKGINPVWYIDITPGRDWLTNPINQLIDAAIAAGDFDASAIARLSAFIEQMGSGTTAQGEPYRKEFWWEREWRHNGDFNLPERIIVLCPEGEFNEFQQYLEWEGQSGVLIDPRWGLEQIIARLAGFSSSDTDML